MKVTKRFILRFLALWPSFSVLGDGSSAAAKSWYVDAYVYQSGDGTSWEKAFKTIQEGINAAADGDTVTVQQGTYPENVEFKGKNIVLTGTNPLDPGVIARTIIQGRQLGPTVTFSGTEKSSCWLSGFTVWDGKAGSGGAIRGNGTLATIGLNVITGGTADSYGGGLYECHGLICLNVITINSSGEGGGGLAYCNGPIQLNVISLCWSGDGGALYECDGLIQDNTTTDCVASGDGGGLYYCDGDILNNTITKCSAGSGGGLDNCNGLIRNNLIARNSAHSLGGGLAGCSGQIRNNLITGNSAANGGGLYVLWAMIENNTITANHADPPYGGGVCNTETGAIRNCIIWGNSDPQVQLVTSSTEVTYCCIQDWTEGGEGNVALNPQLSDPDGPDDDPWTFEDNDCHLEFNSPCIDAGQNQDWMWGAAVDLDGNVGIVRGSDDTSVDMGAYEYGSFRFTITNVERTSSNQLRLTWTSRPGDTYVLTSSAVLNRPDWFQEGTVLSQGATTSFSLNLGTGSRNFYRIEMAH